MITTTLHPAFNSPIDNTVDGIEVDHTTLLADLIHSNLPLVEVAAAHGLSLPQLIAWAAQGPVRALLDAADELARRITSHKATQAAAGALETLIAHLGLSANLKEHHLAGQAARTLTRLAAPAKPRRHRNSCSPSLRDGVGGRVPAEPADEEIAQTAPAAPESAADDDSYSPFLREGAGGRVPGAPTPNELAELCPEKRTDINHNPAPSEDHSPPEGRTNVAWGGSAPQVEVSLDSPPGGWTTGSQDTEAVLTPFVPCPAEPTPTRLPP